MIRPLVVTAFLLILASYSTDFIRAAAVGAVFAEIAITLIRYGRKAIVLYRAPKEARS